MKQNVELSEMDFYSLYLRGHLIDHGFQIRNPEQFVTDRCLAAYDVYKQQLLEGHSHAVCREMAMRCLLDGLYISRYDIIYNIFEEQLWLRLPESVWVPCTLHFLEMPVIHEVMDRYGVNGDYLSRETHQPMLDELLGIITEKLDEYEL